MCHVHQVYHMLQGSRGAWGPWSASLPSCLGYGGTDGLCLPSWLQRTQPTPFCLSKEGHTIMFELLFTQVCVCVGGALGTFLLPQQLPSGVARASREV